MLLMKNDGEGILFSLIWKIRYIKKIKAIKQQRKHSFMHFFYSYINSSDYSISVNTINRINLNQYVYFVCGSDQIWNPYYPQNSMIDFLRFAPATKRVAYAPSFGVSHIPENKVELYKKWLSEIPNLSVREEQGAAIIKKLTGREVTVLADPTLMLNKDEWLAIAKKPSIYIEQKYILTYFLGNQTKEYRKAICEIAEIFSCRVINLLDIREFESYTVDPAEFIYLINRAKLVCTDSFHGAVFAIIMRTNFIVFDRVEDGHSMHSRLETLLKKFGMENRHFKNMKNYEEVINTDFHNTENIISAEQNKAWKYLETTFRQ